MEALRGILSKGVWGSARMARDTAMRSGRAGSVHGTRRQDGKPYAGVGRPVFGPDSKRVAYTAVVGDKLRSSTGRKEPDAPAGTPVFSPDSKSVAIGASSGIASSSF